MKKSYIVIFSILFASCNSSENKSNSQSDSTTSFYLSDTAKSLSSSIEVKNEAWKIDAFTDEFGESDKEKFVKTITYGTFANSATSEEYLKAELLLTLKNAALFLHEYSDSHPSEKFIGTGKLRLKNEEGKDLTVYSYSEWNQQGGLLINNEDFKKLRNFLLTSKGTIKVVVYDDYSSVYTFSIDANSFETKYNELKVPKK